MTAACPRRGFRVPLCLALLAACAPAPSASTATPPPVEIVQVDLDEDERISEVEAAVVARVLATNESFFGAHPVEFCRRLPAEERKACRTEVESVALSEIDGAAAIEENSELDEGGREWPNAASVSNFRRLRLSVPLRKGERKATHEAMVVLFDSARGATTERCAFPLEHWSWSAMDRPERFSRVPVGVCSDRELSVTEYLLEQAPDAAPVVLRFLSEPEARAWAAGDPERIKWDSPYTAGHPYAKYFLLDSQRWWRGGSPPARREGYAWAIRIDALPLRQIRALEERGMMFLDIFEEAAQIELTNVTREGLVAILAEKPEVLVDASGPDDTAPRFETFSPRDGS